MKRHMIISISYIDSETSEDHVFHLLPDVMHDSLDDETLEKIVITMLQLQSVWLLIE